MTYILIKDRALFDKMTEDWQNRQMWYMEDETNFYFLLFKWGIPHVHPIKKSELANTTESFRNYLNSGIAIKIDGIYDTFADAISETDQTFVKKERRTKK
jgi:hypothetical protein